MNDEELRQDGELLEETQVSQGNTENVQQEAETAEQELVMMLYEHTQQERKNMIQIKTSDLRGSKFLHI